MVSFVCLFYVYLYIYKFLMKNFNIFFYNVIWILKIIFSILVLTLLKKEYFYIEELEINFNYYNLYLLINFYNNNILNIFNLFLIYLILTKNYKQINFLILINLSLVFFLNYFTFDLTFLDINYKNIKKSFEVVNNQLFNNLIFFHPLITHSLYSYIVLILIFIKMYKFKLNFYKKKNKNFYFFFFLIKKLIFITLFLSLVIVFLGSSWARQELMWNSWWNWDIIEIMNFVFLLLFFWFIHFMKLSFFKNLLNVIHLNLIYYTIFFFFLLRYDVTGSLHSFNIFEEIEIFIFFFIFVILFWLYVYTYSKIKIFRHQTNNFLKINLYYFIFNIFYFLINFYFLLFFIIMLFDVNFTDDFIFIYSFVFKFFFLILFIIIFLKKNYLFLISIIFAVICNYLIIFYFLLFNFFFKKKLNNKIILIHFLVILISYVGLNEWSFQLTKFFFIKTDYVFLLFKKTFLKINTFNLFLSTSITDNYFYKVLDNNYLYYNFINFFKITNFNDYLSEQMSNIFIKTTNFSDLSYNYYWNEFFIIIYDYNHYLLFVLTTFLLYFHLCLI